MDYEELSLKGFIDEMEDVSNGPHPRKFCFVIGAGASKTSGIKSGQELVDIWDKELANRNNNEYLRWMLAYLLSNTDHNIVITTNFDHLIEDAIHYYMQMIPLVIGHESLAHYVTKKTKRPTIVKIHRDLLFDPANIGDAEKRYIMLSDAIDAFTDKLKNEEPFSGVSAPDINQAVQQITDGAVLQSIYRKAVTLHNENKYSDALLEYQKLIEMEPDNARYHNSLSITLHEMKRYDEALAASQKAVELKPDGVDYIWGVGADLYRLGRYCEALNELDKAISQSSLLDRAYIYRGLAKIQLELENNSDHFETAIDDFDVAIKICQTEYRNYRDRAEGYLLMNKLTEAESNLNDACNIDDQDPDIYHLYALMFKKRGDVDKAMQYLQKSKTLGYIEPLQYEQIS